MAISRTPKNREESIFGQPTAQIFEDVDGEDTKKVEKDRIAELEDALKEMRERQLEAQSDALLSQPSPQWQSQVTERQPEIKPESIQLPDPALDPEGYATGLQRRIEVATENKRRSDDNDRKRNEDINSKVNDLWADFGDEYPDYSEDKERINFVASVVVNEATKKGLDVNRYMFGTGRSRFMKDVVKKYDKVFGAPEIDDNGEDYEDTPRRRSRSASPPPRRRPADRSRTEDDEGRSAGVFGGNDGSGRSARRSEPVEDRSSMIDDIQLIQRKSGFF